MRRSSQRSQHLFATRQGIVEPGKDALNSRMVRHWSETIASECL